MLAINAILSFVRDTWLGSAHARGTYPRIRRYDIRNTGPEKIIREYLGLLSIHTKPVIHIEFLHLVYTSHPIEMHTKKKKHRKAQSTVPTPLQQHQP